jgi:hypothetical protein
MSFGGSASKNNSATNTDLSAAATQRYNTVANPAIADATQAFTPYTGQLAPGLSQGQQQAAQMAQANVGAGQATTQQGILGATSNSGFTPSTVQAGQLANTNLSPYLNPYVSDVVDTTNQQLDQQRQRDINSNASEYVAGGAFGGSRQGVSDAQTNQYYGQLGAQTDANLYSAGYGQAQQAALADIGNSLTAQTANQNAGIQGAQVRNTASGLLGQLGQQQQTMGANDANLIDQYGTQAQQTQAAQDAAAYANYQYNNQFPLTQAQTLTGILGATPWNSNSKTSGSTLTASAKFGG